jgi:hypothetical protein
VLNSSIRCEFFPGTFLERRELNVNVDGGEEKWDLVSWCTEIFSGGFTMSRIVKVDKSKRKHSKICENERDLKA